MQLASTMADRLKGLPLEVLQASLRAMETRLDDIKRSRKLFDYYPEFGPLRRELYPKHMAFFEAGAIHRERLMLAANRVGKTEGVGGYELALHATGLYPDWWKGKRFKRPVSSWVAGDTSKTVFEILQEKLLGRPGYFGTGLIPKANLVQTTSKHGVSDGVDTAYISHVSGGDSRITFKSYDQGREVFQGTEQDIIWLDEEPPMSVYTECLIRTMTTNGIVMLTFTPIRGLSDVVLSFLPGGKIEGLNDE